MRDLMSSLGLAGSPKALVKAAPAHRATVKALQALVNKARARQLVPPTPLPGSRPGLTEDSLLLGMSKAN